MVTAGGVGDHSELVAIGGGEQARPRRSGLGATPMRRTHAPGRRAAARAGGADRGGGHELCGRTTWWAHMRAHPRSCVLVRRGRAAA